MPGSSNAFTTFFTSSELLKIARKPCTSIIEPFFTFLEGLRTFGTEVLGAIAVEFEKK